MINLQCLCCNSAQLYLLADAIERMDRAFILSENNFKRYNCFKYFHYVLPLSVFPLWVMFQQWWRGTGVCEGHAVVCKLFFPTSACREVCTAVFFSQKKVVYLITSVTNKICSSWHRLCKSEKLTMHTLRVHLHSFGILSAKWNSMSSGQRGKGWKS